MGWIDVEKELPQNDDYILVSFENFDLPDIARYEVDNEGGAFYPGDDEKSYVQYGLFVNAWKPLPKPYRPKQDNEKDGHVNIFEKPMTEKEQLELSDLLDDFLQMYENGFADHLAGDVEDDANYLEYEFRKLYEMVKMLEGRAIS